ncbi:MAG: sigma-54 dependent transcriptional regulator [Acidobacteriota bacterium]|nr:sigma-54 dependent transcriptional regulator [Acidobacteriota bacterium]
MASPGTARAQSRQMLEDAGYTVRTESDPAAAVRLAAEHRYDAVLFHTDLQSARGADRMRSLKLALAGTPVLALCSPSDPIRPSNALRHGADDYLMLPLDRHELRTRLRRILEMAELDSRVAYFQDQVSKRTSTQTLKAQSQSMQNVLERIDRVAPMRSTVLVVGESGVGKELVARSIHFKSTRTRAPFIPLNCAAIPPNLIESELFGHERGAFTGAHVRARGKFEIAHGGSLFLDEIGELGSESQAKLLRVLDEREFMRVGGDRSVRVDVRVIAATNADLETLVRDRSFREDLYYRLKVVTIRVPPLRERRPDIPHLVETFLSELSRANAIALKRISPEALQAMQRHTWPGNVRELKNMVESILVSSRTEIIEIDDLPQEIRETRSLPRSGGIAAGMTLAEMERELILRTLEQTGGNRTHSATLLGIGVRTLQRKLHTYGIDVPSTRRRPRRSSRHDK